MASISSSGFGSGLDVNGIVSQLMSAERQALTKYDRAEAGYQVKISAFASLKSSLASVQSAAAALTDPKQFTGSRATVGDSSLFGATVVGSAAEGTYSVEVQTLAGAQKLKSAGHASSSAIVGTGTLTIQLGTYDSGANTFTPNPDKAEHTVTIDAAHSSLAGVRDAINAAKGDITASIVNDGGTNGARLVVTSKSTGTQSSVKITVSDADGNNTDGTGLSELAYDPTVAAGSGKNMTETVAASDAKIVVDGITVTKQTNTITDAVEGVTLTLTKANLGTPTTLTVARDASSGKGAIQAFVKAYNDFERSVKQMTGYDEDSKKAGTLIGDAGARGVEAQLRGVITSAGGGATGLFKVLAEVGVAFTKDGLLEVNSSKLDAALSKDTDSVAALFAVQGAATDTQVSVASSTSKTGAGKYNLEITQIATHGTATGTQAANLTITQGANDLLDLEIDGKAVSVQLTAKTYANAAALAAEIQTKVNGAAALKDTGVTLTASETAGVIQLTSSSYGTNSTVKLKGGSGAVDILGAGGATEVAGVDVAGKIDGIPATGSGQSLTAAQGSTAEGLKLTVLGGPIGQRGTVSFSRGISDRLGKVIDQLTGSKGLLTAKTDSYNASIKRNSAQRDAESARLDQVEANYRAQFTALDKMVSQLNSTASFLAQQFTTKSSG